MENEFWSEDDDGPFDDFPDDYFDDYGDEEEDPFEQQYLAEFPEYTSVRQLYQEVTFIRPDFSQEDKTVLWCLTNGFEEVQPGIWSGPWYWREQGEEGSMARARQNRIQRLEQVTRQRQELMNRNVDDATFQKVVLLKVKGNAAFSQRNFAQALKFYKVANELGGLGLFLTGDQRAEKVRILSNMAECHLRMNNPMEAGCEATEALQLDNTHVKSRIRRAKATFRLAELQSDEFGINPMFTSQAEEDLDMVIHWNGEGVNEAQAIKQKFENDLQASVDKLRRQGLLDPRDR
uniref:Uncharacterized protein n=1 Tax=Entomoneis paludosa TaxID=265537 RepID=A0A7S2YD21_9STRA|mmetsp:Transcript_27663/g.57908  ORF Transcript_27663/g.57908 Transcript_27663/m.57908 type:complete len:291 (+) Transcript_27663:74-946(+)